MLALEINFQARCGAHAGNPHREAETGKPHRCTVILVYLARTRSPRDKEGGSKQNMAERGSGWGDWEEKREIILLTALKKNCQSSSG